MLKSIIVTSFLYYHSFAFFCFHFKFSVWDHEIIVNNEGHFLRCTKYIITVKSLKKCYHRMLVLSVIASKILKQYFMHCTIYNVKIREWVKQYFNYDESKVKDFPIILLK